MNFREFFEVERSDEPLLSDRAGALDAERSVAVSEKLGALGQWTGGRGAFLAAALPMVRSAAKADPKRPVRCLFAGAGCAEQPRALVAACRRRGVKILVNSTDPDRDRTARARELCEAWPEIECAVADPFRLADREPESVDLAFASRLFHRHPSERAVALLNILGRLARRGIAAEDSLRHPLALMAAQGGAALLGGGSLPEFQRDAAESVRRSFTLEEWAEIASLASLPGLTIWPRGPWRVAIQWERLVEAIRSPTPAEIAAASMDPTITPAPAG